MDQIYARREVTVVGLGHENIVTLGMYMVLAGVVVAFPIHGDLDSGDRIQVMGEFFSPLAGIAFHVVGDVDVASGDGHLHQ